MNFVMGVLFGGRGTPPKTPCRGNIIEQVYVLYCKDSSQASGASIQSSRGSIHVDVSEGES